MDGDIHPRSLLLLCSLSWLIGLLSAPLARSAAEIWRTLTLGFRIGAKSVSRRHKLSASKDTDDEDGTEVKLVLCVRTDLEMGKGKIAAQCGHAAVGAYIDSINRKNPYLEEWMNDGQKKIVLKVKSREEMAELRRSAAAANVNYHITCDAGRTQIPAGSYTVIAIGPAPENVVNKITGHLKLL
ncbi:peptidyl-tRNA hydrolase [Babesia ovis]|uniref:peptidyl-tRNA hydrolase n=1 Tax=Babesia ovis TaxID=5869 RepID=A0A9W5T9N9_BABOV|nr:peptidyl-tRNA hydrolase [Babesia ovis]